MCLSITTASFIKFLIVFKKVSHIIVTILILLSTFGVSISSHYCGGHLRSISLFTEAKTCCGDTEGGCCHTENDVVVLDDDYTVQTVTAATAPLEISLFCINIICEYSLSNIFTTYTLSVYSDLPIPDSLSKRISILQSFII